MKLVVFDLDGTLTMTNAVDSECFIQALRVAFGLNAINENWAEYECVTDLGVIVELFKGNFDRQPDPAELSSFVECFVSFLRQAHTASPDGFAQVPGAAALLNRFQQNGEWGAAIATGCWEDSARFKMTAAGIGGSNFPAAFAEDGPARETIVQAAIARAAAQYRHPHFERIVLVGDATWDVRTARRLGLPLVGVAHGRQVDLWELGVSHVLSDFNDHAHCLSCLEEATVPGFEY
jgi:phosphoglycolate phosphatase-like HAD superfamily hydrolase